MGRVDVVEPAEREQLLTAFNDTVNEVPEATLVGLFERQVALAPHAVAVRFGDVSLSYGELHVRATRLAHHLIGRGVGPETLVGICLERSADLVTALLAVLKAGGAYLPIDPAAGDVVVLWNSSANYDEEVFADPGTFDLGRTPNKHVSFGYGPHFCLGAHLGRVEIAALLYALRVHVAEGVLTGSGKPIHSDFLHGDSSLPLTLRPAR